MALSNEASVKLKLLLQNHITTPLQRAKQQLSGSVGEMQDKLNQLKATHASAFNDMKDEIPGLGRAMELATNPYVLATAAVVALGIGFTAMTNKALDWESGLAKINVTAQLSRGELDSLSNKLLDIGRNNVAPLEQIPDAFNKIISAGLNVNDSLKALDPTLKAAKAGFVDVSTVATAGVNVMNSSGKDINQVYDVLFATLNKGAAEMGDIANYLPKLVPGAKQAGFSLGETAGAFAFMTAQGQRAEASTTLLENAFKTLADPAKATAFKKIGVSFYDNQGKMLPLISIVKQLSSELDGLTDAQKAKKLASLGIDQQTTSAFAIMTQNVEKLSGIIDATTNSQGALNKAYTDSMTSTDMWKQALNNVSFIMIKIGQLFLPIVKWVGKIAMSFTNWLIPALVTAKNALVEWAPVVYGIGAAFLLLNAKLIFTAALTSGVAIATNVWTAAQWLLNVALTANPIGLIIVGIGALVGIIAVIVKKYEGWATVWNAVKITLINGFKQYVETWKYGFTILWLNIQIFWAKLKGFGEYVTQLFTNIGAAMKLALSGNFTEAKKVLSQKIVTKSEAEVKILENKRSATTSQFVSETTARLRETALAIANVKLTKKKTQAKTSEATTDHVATETTTPEANAGKPIKDTTDAVAGSAQQIKNLTVNIDSFNKGGINTQNTELQHMNGNEIADWFNNAMLRMIRNLEMSY